MRRIDKDEAQRRLLDRIEYRSNHGGSTYCKGLMDAKNVIGNLPTVEAEPVIRCKDCNCAEPHGLKQYCKLYGIVKDDNGFCDEAEPKGKEQ